MKMVFHRIDKIVRTEFDKIRIVVQWLEALIIEGKSMERAEKYIEAWAQS